LTVTNEAKRNEDTVEPLVRLSFLVGDVMQKCRKDFMRQIQDFDFCEVCPLLAHCHAQEHEMDTPVSSVAESAPYAPADGSDGRCPTCRQRNSRAGKREMDDGSVIVWRCNVLGCSNSEDHPNEKAEVSE
jgi:hypothetical protein